jgi:transcriptional regulator with XRE-family HTH domain
MFVSKITGKRIRKTGFVSNITGKRIRKDRISKNWRQQAVNELFPGKTVATAKRIKRTFDEYRRLELGLIESSPGIERYLIWLQEHNDEGRIRLLREFDGESQDSIDDSPAPLARRKKGKVRRAKRI